MELLPAIGLLLIMSATLLLIGRRRGDGSDVRGLRTGGKMFVNLLPLLLLAFTLAGLLRVALPPELIRSWLGAETGLTGIFVGGVCGALVLGGPYAVFPIIAEVYRIGAGIGAAVAMISGWALLGVAQLIMGIAFIGVRFALIRTLIVLAFPFVAGLTVYVLADLV